MEASVGCKDRLPRIKMMICKRRKQVAKAMPVKGEQMSRLFRLIQFSA